MRRFMAAVGMLVVSSAGLVGVTTSTASASPGSPVGAFDSVSARFDGVWAVSGWAADGDAPGQPVEVRIYLGGTFISSTTTGDSRPDVAAAVPGAGPSTGWHSTIDNFQLFVSGHGNPLCAYAINVGVGANRLLGCQTLPTSGSSPFNPVGNLEAGSQTPGILNLRGWAADPDGDPTTQLRVYIDGNAMLQTTAALSRPDVARSGLSATSGFNLSLPVLPQDHFTCVYAQNTGRAGLQNTTIGCAHTQERARPAPGAHDPRGNFENAPLGGTEQNLQFGGTGWGYDPDSSAPATVRFMGLGSFQGGPPLSLTTTDVQTGIARPDVQTQFPAAGPSSGFSGTNVTGAQRPAWLCVYLLNVGPGTNQFLGCATWFYSHRTDQGPPVAIGWDLFGPPGPFAHE